MTSSPSATSSMRCVAQITDDVGPGFDVETDRGFVENEQARPVQQRACDFETSHLTPGQVAHLVFGPLGQRNAGQKVIGTLPAFMVADAVQRRMIGQVLNDGEIEVEGARLEYDADHAQGFARRGPDVIAKNADMTALNRVETGHQGEQRALAGT